MRCFFGVQGVPPGTRVCWGLPGAGGVSGGAPTSLFSMLGGDRLGLGQWVTPSSWFLAGEDGTVAIPQLVPCVVQVGEEAETRSPKPLRGPPGCAGQGLAGEISNPAGVARGKEKGARLGSGEPQQRLQLLTYRSVLCFSFPHQQVCPQGCPMQGAGAEGSGHGSGGAFRGHRFIHSFIPCRARFQTGCVLVFACAPAAVGGSPGGWQHLGVSQVGGKCQGPFSEGADAHWSPCCVVCGFLSGRSTGTVLGEDFGDSVCVQTHIVIALSRSAGVASHRATLCVLTCFPLNPPGIPPASPTPGLILTTGPGNIWGFQSQKLGRF